MEQKFEELLLLLNDSSKEAQLKLLWNSATNCGRLGIISALREFLGIEEFSTKELIDTLLK